MEQYEGPKKKWWGLLEDGELIAVRCFSARPSIYDFAVCTFSWCEYEVRHVHISIAPI